VADDTRESVVRLSPRGRGCTEPMIGTTRATWLHSYSVIRDETARGEYHFMVKVFLGFLVLFVLVQADSSHIAWFSLPINHYRPYVFNCKHFFCKNDKNYLKVVLRYFNNLQTSSKTATGGDVTQESTPPPAHICRLLTLTRAMNELPDGRCVIRQLVATFQGKTL